MTPQFSVIVPVYNAERWIACCVESILAQTYESWELICIDDGSEDSSGKILDEIALKDTRVRIIHKANAGVSAARNDGINKARGKYVVFVDADDFLNKYALTILNDCIVVHTPDLLQFLYSDKPSCCSEYREYIRYVNEESGLAACSGFVWDKVFLLDIIKANQIFFDEKMTLCEDFHFVFRYAVLCNKICYTTAAVYVKRPLHDGLCHSAVRQWERCPENAVANIRLLWSLADVCNRIYDKDTRKACRVFLLGRSFELYAFFLYKIHTVAKSPCRKKLKAALRYPLRELTREIPFLLAVRIFIVSLKALLKKGVNKFFRTASEKSRNDG